MPASFLRYRNELVLFSVGFLVSLLLFLVSYGRLGLPAIQWGGNDFVEYSILAENWLSGHGFSLRNAEPYAPSALRTPGYPFFLALSFQLSGGTLLASIFQMICLGALAVLAYRILTSLGLSTRLSFWASFLTVLEPDVSSMSVYLISDILFSVLILGALASFLEAYRTGRSRWFLLAEALVGASSLVRPVGLAVGVVFFVVWVFKIFKDSRVPHGKNLLVLFLGGVCLIVFLLPWSFRNHRLFGTYRLSSADTYNLYTIIVPQIHARRDGVSFADAREHLLENFLTAPELQPLPQITNMAYQPHPAEFLMLENFQYEGWMREKFREAIAADSAFYLKSIAIGVYEYFSQVNWATPLMHWNLADPPHQPNISLLDAAGEGPTRFLSELKTRFSCGIGCLAAFGLSMIGRLVWIIVAPLSLWGVYVYMKAVPHQRVLLISMILALGLLAAIHIVVLGELVQPRYRLQAVPFFLAFALVGLLSLGRRGKYAE